MPVIPDAHGILIVFDIIWPYGRLNEGSGSIVTEMVHGKCYLSKVGSSIDI